ncbi:unnamed protein product [Spirodela intermedia]|uniref:RING-type domain-containing protein n=2 Tax=Spirodela intermedia TaxID=51605 RepID=A0A7I8JQI2_SPIIN|nr:unnamed protein product [Spirodela intermedia]CAA6672400.1 unnamed protein product [Spirodela intermedia]CAA7409584.1 unnamed protein product [Spirodela intermedia]
MGCKSSKGASASRHHRYSQQSDRHSLNSASSRSLDPAHVGVYPMDYLRISQRFQSHEQVSDALAQAGLESSNMILGVDFTKSNEWTGKFSFGRRCLHDLNHPPNPYEQAISIVRRTLSSFDEDNRIPCFGFGDVSTHDQSVFSFTSDGKPCNGFDDVLQCYREIASNAQLAGPTSFAPIIEAAMGVVDESGGQYHVLLVIADGQVTQSVNPVHGHLSVQEIATINAIVKASDYPLSIVVVGVGDGPWDTMRDFSDRIPARRFDNFQFVNFTEIMARDLPQKRKEAEFVLAALRKVPSQYRATVDLQLLGCRKGFSKRKCLPPPILCHSPAGSQREGGGSIIEYKVKRSPESSPQINGQRCPVCLCNVKDLAFGCGHQTCYDCGGVLQFCPICRSSITIKIRLY